MKRILTLLILLLILCGLVTAQSGPILSSSPETSKNGVQVFVKEDSAGARQLQVYVSAGGTNNGLKPETVYSGDVSARAFDSDGKEMGLTEAPGFGNEKGVNLIAVCNAGSCNAIKIYYFSVPKPETDRIRKVVVVFRSKQSELIMAKYPQPNPKN